MNASPASIKEHLSLFSQPARLRVPAFRVIDRMDGRIAPADQILGTAVALVAMCEAVGVPMREVIERAERSMKEVDSCQVEHIRAIKQYAANEITRRPRR